MAEPVVEYDTYGPPRTSAFASSNPGLSGWLYKSSGGKRTILVKFDRRWFVLDGAVLRYSGDRRRELAAEARGADVARQCAAPVADDAAADARAAALLPRAAAGCLGAARELAALRRDQLGLREAQAAQADRFLAHHEKARFAGAVRFAATLERDADGPVVDRIVGFL